MAKDKIQPFDIYFPNKDIMILVKSADVKVPKQNHRYKAC